MPRISKNFLLSERTFQDTPPKPATPSLPQKLGALATRIIHSHCNFLWYDLNPFNLTGKTDVLERSTDFSRSLIPSNVKVKMQRPPANSSMRKCRTIEDTTKVQEEFADRAFAYFAAQGLLSYICHFSQEELSSASIENSLSQIANKVAKNKADFWTEFKAKFWNKMTVTQKVKSFAAYHLFGDVLKVFIEDLTKNVMTFVREKYATKSGIDNFFNSFLRIIYNFLSAYRQTAQDSIDNTSTKATLENPGNNFVDLLQTKLKSQYFLRVNGSNLFKIDGDPDPRNYFKSEEELRNFVVDKLIERFLPNLRLKEVFLSKFDYSTWNLNTWTEKAVYLPLYLAYAFIHLPFLIVSYLFEGKINSSVFKKGAKKEAIAKIEELKKGWDRNHHKQFLGLVSSVLDQFQNSSNNETISRTHLNNSIRTLIKGVVQELVVTLDISNPRIKTDRHELANVLQQRNGIVDEKVRQGLERSIEEGLLFLFSAFTKEDRIESYFYNAFERLNDFLSPDNGKKQVKTVKDGEVLTKTKKVIAPFIETSVNASLGEGPTQGSREVARFFKDYQERHAEELFSIRAGLESDVAKDTIDASSLDLALVNLNKHRDGLVEDFENFKDMFSKYFAIAVKEVSQKLYAIADKQHAIFTHLNDAKINYNDSITAQKVSKNLEELEKTLNNIDQFQLTLLKKKSVLQEKLYKSLSDLNYKRLNHFQNYHRLSSILQYADNKIFNTENSLITTLGNHIKNSPKDVVFISKIKKNIIQSFSFQSSLDQKNYSKAVGKALDKFTGLVNSPSRIADLPAAKDELLATLRTTTEEIKVKQNQELAAQNNITKSLTALIEKDLASANRNKTQKKSLLDHNVKAAIDLLTSIETTTRLLKEDSIYSMHYKAVSMPLLYFLGPYAGSFSANLLATAPVQVAQTAKKATSVFKSLVATPFLNPLWQKLPELPTNLPYFTGWGLFERNPVQGVLSLLPSNKWANGLAAPKVNNRIESAFSFISDNDNYKAMINNLFLVLANELNS
ncbi:MAG: hypothetical protein COT84_01285 [Chlamydiae bacterium CG10_big_fil_rev_8_21_14_0_10_35_9]|nr:MAG: hypothetical protein COT84_01285 [Chlamydiae bacterium CG10_big_fil_rev_8_21_14_0_10_35_9]